MYLALGHLVFFWGKDFSYYDGNCVEMDLKRFEYQIDQTLISFSINKFISTHVVHQ